MKSITGKQRCSIIAFYLYVGVAMEVWKLSRIDKNYEVSNLGGVRSIKRIEEVVGHWGGTYKRNYGGKMMSPCQNRLGYLQISGTNKKFHHVHRLVAFEFCEGHKEGLFVNHKNGIRNDNRAENLEWVTHQENLIHAYKVLKVKGVMAGRFGKDHPASIPVTRVCIETGEKFYYDSVSDAARDGFCGGSISRCARGLSKSHKGFYWLYATGSMASVTWSEPALAAYNEYREAQ